MDNKNLKELKNKRTEQDIKKSLSEAIELANELKRILDKAHERK